MEVLDMLVHLIAGVCGLIVLLVSLDALSRMSINTSMMIQLAYYSLFCGGGASTIISGWEMWTGQHSSAVMHVTLLIMVTGLAVLMVCSRRKNHRCDECPTRHTADCDPDKCLPIPPR